MSKQLIFVYSKMKFKAKFKGLKNASALTLELRDGNGTIIGTADKIEKNRFKLKLDPSLLASAKKKKCLSRPPSLTTMGRKPTSQERELTLTLHPTVRPSISSSTLEKIARAETEAHNATAGG
jgi:hypothetical protein